MKRDPNSVVLASERSSNLLAISENVLEDVAVFVQIVDGY